MEGTHACDDCVVSFVVSREPGSALVIDYEEERAVRMLAGAGLVPGIRHIRKVAGDESSDGSAARSMEEAAPAAADQGNGSP